MQYKCAQCHHAWSVEGESEPHACPNCKAEAGLEPEHGIPFAMMAFGLSLAGAAIASIVGSLWPALG